VVASDTVAAVVDRGPCHPRSPTAATTTQIRSRGNGVYWKLHIPHPPENRIPSFIEIMNAARKAQ